MKRIFKIVLLGLAITGLQSMSSQVYAQKKSKSYLIDTLITPIPAQRLLYTNRVNNAIDMVDKRDGAKDKFIKFRDDASSTMVTKAFIKDAPALITLIENMDIPHATKLKYHLLVERTIRKMNNLPWSQTSPKYFGAQFKLIKEMIVADYKGNLSSYVKKQESADVLEYIETFENPEATSFLYERLALNNPEKLIEKLPKIEKEPYADQIIIAAARVMPNKILDYAMSTSSLNGLVRRNSDPVVKSIVKIADNATNKRKVLPFIGAINRGEKTIQEVDKIANSKDQYFQALVDLIVADEQLGRKDLEQEIQLRGNEYVTEINALHNSSDGVRFKCLQGLRDIDLYVVMISGQEEIYTSSYTKGTFALLLKKMGKKSGDVLLEELNHFHFRAFLRMAAGFNRISNFLATMTEEQKTTLLSRFVNNLEKGINNELSDAVDVADAYGSIKDPKLLAFIQQEVLTNFQRVKDDHHKKGIIVYGILNTIVNGSATVGQDELPIPPITYVPISSVKNENGEIIEQMFFYGDGSGKSSYNLFLSSVRRDGRFTIKDEGKYWIKISSKNTPNPLIIYCNKPLTEPQDEVAQRALQEHFLENNITPTVMVHRGHSYFVPTTIEYITPDVKMIVLGSCGGYQNLSTILNTAEDANIISSKQTGTGPVNEAILRKFHSYLMTKEDMNWIELWTELEKDVSRMTARDKDIFSDYVPPNKNLGAIFIKAYNKMLERM